MVATSIAIGIARDKIDAELYKMNLSIVVKDIPFPKNRSKCLTMNCVRSTNTSMNTDKKKGGINSFKIYLFIILTQW